MTPAALTERIRDELQRNARDHCFIRAVELEKIWSDRSTRKVALHEFAEKHGFALAWYDEQIGVIFIKDLPRHQHNANE